MRRLASFCIFALPLLAQERAPKHELAFQLGGFAAVSRKTAGESLRLGPGVALQTNYARRFVEWRHAALYGEVHFLASPLREVTSANSRATRDVASLYAGPGVRVKFRPLSAISPYVAAGGGPAWYEQSTSQIGGEPNTAPRQLVRAGFNFGGGVDVRVWSWLALRGEIRDFYTGSPAYNLSSIRGGQHNVVAGAAFVIRRW